LAYSPPAYDPVIFFLLDLCLTKLLLYQKNYLLEIHNIDYAKNTIGGLLFIIKKLIT